MYSLKGDLCCGVRPLFPLKVDLWVRWSLASYWRFLPAVSLYFFFKPLSFSPSLSQLSAALVFSFLSVNLSLISLHRSVSQLSFRHCLSSLFLSALSALSYSQRPPSATPSVLSFSPKHFFICLLYLALSIHPLHTLFGHLFTSFKKKYSKCDRTRDPSCKIPK